MKRIILSALFCAGIYTANAQQLQTSSFYDLQGVFHNPAMAGVNKYTSIGATYRTMWDGIDGGPQTATLFGSAYLPSAKLGLGAYIYNDKTGPTQRTGLQMAYAYHVPLKNDASFSIGLEARLQQFSYDKAKLQQSLGSSDPVLATSDSRFKFDAGLGFAYTNKKFQVGASVSQLIQSKLDFYSGNLTTNEEAKLYRHYYLHGNYKWDIDGSTVLTPNVLFIYLPNAPLEFQGGIRVEHKQVFWWGVAWKANQSWLLSAGVKLQKKFNIGYGFDLFSTPLSTFDKGANAHEIFLRYDFLK